MKAETDDENKRARQMTFVLVGAGATGVELAASIAHLAAVTLRGQFRRIDPAKSAIILVEGGNLFCRPSPRACSKKAARRTREARRQNHDWRHASQVGEQCHVTRHCRDGGCTQQGDARQGCCCRGCVRNSSLTYTGGGIGGCSSKKLDLWMMMKIFRFCSYRIEQNGFLRCEFDSSAVLDFGAAAWSFDS